MGECQQCQDALKQDIENFAETGLLEGFRATLLSLYPDLPGETPTTVLYARYLAGYHDRGHTDEGHDPWEGLC